VIVVSSDLKELLGLCDRIAVMSAGRLVRIFAREHFDQDKIMAEALSGHVADRPEEVTILPATHAGDSAEGQPHYGSTSA